MAGAGRHVTLMVAVGNALRRDDGVAARVLASLGPASGCDHLCVVELTPELAERVAAASRVVFVDADPSIDEPFLAPVEPLEATSRHSDIGWPLSHGLQPADLIELARCLYAFEGEAWLCRVPARDLALGEGLSPTAAAHMASAVALLRAWL